MPAVRRGTVTEDIPGAIRAISGTMDWKGDKEGIVRVPIGRVCLRILKSRRRTNGSSTLVL